MDPPAQISALLEAISEKERILQQRKAAAASWLAAEDDALDEVDRVDELLAAAQEELRVSERERDDIMAQYEACQQNRLQHSQAEEFKKEIVDAESELSAADATIADLEKKLHSVSASYKNERERRMLMLAKVHGLVSELYTSVERKIALTFREDEPDAKAILKVIASISREREAECSQWGKYVREMKHIVELKRARTQELQLESERNVAALADAKNVEIKELVEKCESERAAIMTDISELKEVHRMQLEQLRNVRLCGDKSGRMDAKGGAAAGRPTTVSAEQFLSEKLHEHEHEREALESTLRQISQDRQKLVLTMRQLQQEIETEKSKHQRSMQQLDAQMTHERQEIASLEKDNRQLRDLCDSLAATLRSGFLVQ